MMVRDQRTSERDLEYEYEYADGGYASETNGRARGGDTNRRVESPPPPPADAWARAAPERDDGSGAAKSRGGTTNGDAPQSPGRKGFDADEDML